MQQPTDPNAQAAQPGEESQEGQGSDDQIMNQIADLIGQLSPEGQKSLLEHIQQLLSGGQEQAAPSAPEAGANGSPVRGA